MQSLRSTAITAASALLRIAPPLCLASVLSLLRGFRLNFSLNIKTTGSHVPHKSLYSGSRHLYAGCHPVSNQVSTGLIPEMVGFSGFDII
jgi:hypothetical protein